MKLFGIAILCALVVMAHSDKTYYKLEEAPQLFEKFMQEHNRVYKDEADRQTHYEAFKQSLATINEQNAKSSSATFGINKFADYTAEERKHMFGLRRGN